MLRQPIRMRLQKRLLISGGAGFGMLAVLMVLSQFELLQPAPIFLLLPGVFTVAKLAGAPCSTSHVTSCSFWDVNLQIVNTPVLTAAWVAFDFLLYAAAAFGLAGRGAGLVSRWKR